MRLQEVGSEEKVEPGAGKAPPCKHMTTKSLDHLSQTALLGEQPQHRWPGAPAISGDQL